MQCHVSVNTASVHTHTSLCTSIDINKHCHSVYTTLHYTALLLYCQQQQTTDPPRIWSPFGEYPGTAFTRSMGDVIAEELGVSADPEIIHRKLHSGDRYIIIASDGVFEFLTNQVKLIATLFA
jgi:serine/threonine protein phosphatase PrpC